MINYLCIVHASIGFQYSIHQWCVSIETLYGINCALLRHSYGCLNNKIAIICMETTTKDNNINRRIFLFPLSCRNWFPFYLPLYFDYDYYYSITLFLECLAHVFSIQKGDVYWLKCYNYLVTLAALYLPNRQFVIWTFNRRDLIFLREIQSSACFSNIQTLTNPISTSDSSSNLHSISSTSKFLKLALLQMIYHLTND